MQIMQVHLIEWGRNYPRVQAKVNMAQMQLWLVVRLRISCNLHVCILTGVMHLWIDPWMHSLHRWNDFKAKRPTAGSLWFLFPMHVPSTELLERWHFLLHLFRRPDYNIQGPTQAGWNILFPIQHLGRRLYTQVCRDNQISEANSWWILSEVAKHLLGPLPVIIFIPPPLSPSLSFHLHHHLHPLSPWGQYINHVRCLMWTILNILCLSAK